ANYGNAVAVADANPGITYSGGWNQSAQHDNVVIMNSGASATSVNGSSGNNNTVYFNSNTANFSGNSSDPHQPTGSSGNGVFLQTASNSLIDQTFQTLENQPGGQPNTVYYNNPSSTIDLASLGTTPTSPKIVHITFSGAVAMPNSVTKISNGSFYGVVYV